MRTAADDAVADQPLVGDTRPANILDIVKPIGVLLTHEIATFQNNNAQTCTRELPGYGSTRWPRPYNTDITL
jgi:hypothetical protein